MNATQTVRPDQVTDEQLAADPHAFDAKLAGLYEAHEKASAARDSAESRIHALAGDRKEYVGRRGPYWRRTMAEVTQTARQLRDAGERGRMNIDPAQALKDYGAAQVAQADALLAISDMETIYARHGWPRYFPCLNRDGHIHASYRGCPTVRFDTLMAWRPDLSGLTVDEAVQMPPKGLGPALCSVCFPLAPVEQRSMTTGQVADELTRGEREAAAAERQAKKDAKQLTEAEQFRTEGQFSDRITTVAACKELIRKAIELEVEAEYWAARSPEGWTAEQITRRQASLAADLASARQDATRAAYVLIARETRHEGWGANEGQITKMRSNKRKSARKEWGLS